MSDIEELRQEVAALREQIKGLTEALVTALASQGPTYVPYVPYTPPPPVQPWPPVYPWIRSSPNTCSPPPGTRMNPIITVQESIA